MSDDTTSSTANQANPTTVEEAALTITPAEQLVAMKARADLLGVKYHPSISLEKLTEKVTAALAAEANTSSGAADPEPEAPAEKTEGQIALELLQDATKLVRIRVTCMNPAKKDWEGEIFSVGNSVVGTHKKYVPFNVDVGYHVPNIIYQHMLGRECQIFVNGKDSKGNARVTGKVVKEFAIEVLDSLTEDELAELARRQAMAQSVD